MVHFNVDARPALTEDVRELAKDVGSDLADEERAAEAGETTLVGRFGARSGVTVGDRAEVAVDTRALHFFDPETGLGIYDGSKKEGSA
jgi:multiple sugar transport system ATP-binding protein